MDREWARLQEDADAAAACARWATRSVVLSGCRRPQDVVDRVRAAPDEVLLVLLEDAVRGGALAGRVVLQAMLPKVVLMASLDAAAEVDDYLTALWCEVAAYPVRRRRSSVAANLALDTLKSVRRERCPPHDVATPPHLVVLAADRHGGRGPVEDGRPDGGLTADVVLRQAHQHRLVDPRTRDLLRSVYAEGLSGEAAAQRHGLSPGAVRSRCSRAVRVLSRHRALLAEGS